MFDKTYKTIETLNMIETRVKVLNIKSDFLSSGEALSKVQTEIEAYKINNLVKVLIVIHGYGSTGKGGIIKRDLHTFLPTFKKQNKILDFIPNEKFATNNEKYTLYTKLYPELLLNSNLQNLNPGVTLIFLK